MASLDDATFCRGYFIAIDQKKNGREFEMKIWLISVVLACTAQFAAASSNGWGPGTPISDVEIVSPDDGSYHCACAILQFSSTGGDDEDECLEGLNQGTNRVDSTLHVWETEGLGEFSSGLSVLYPGNVGRNVQWKAPDFGGNVTVTVVADDGLPHGDGFENYSFYEEDPVTHSVEITILKIATETMAIVPPDRTRKKIGVGEEVRLDLEPAVFSDVLWSIEGDGSITETNETYTYFISHDRASTPTITATYSGVSCGVAFNVVEPSGITFVKTASLNANYIAGQAGCGMECTLTINPTDVSFYMLQWKEDPGPATNVVGFFAVNPPFTDTQLQHTPNSFWEEISPDNKIILDTAKYNDSIPNGFLGYPSWSDGGFDWIIPNRYRVFDAIGAAADGYIFQYTIQQFKIEEDGRTTVTKQGDGPEASISRLP